MINGLHRIGTGARLAGALAGALVAAAPALATAADVRTELLGGTQGAPVGAACPDGAFLTGFVVKSAVDIWSIAPVCARPAASPEGRPLVVRHEGRIGSASGTIYKGCSKQPFVSQLHVSFTAKEPPFRVAGIAGLCGPLGGPPSPGERSDSFTIYGSRSGLDLDGKTLSCPYGFAPAGLHGLAGDVVYALGLICRDVTARARISIPVSSAPASATIKAPAITAAPPAASGSPLQGAIASSPSAMRKSSTAIGTIAKTQPPASGGITPPPNSEVGRIIGKVKPKPPEPGIGPLPWAGPGVDFTGSWTTTTSLGGVYTMTLKQQGAAVTGAYLGDNAPIDGELGGSLYGRTLSFGWKQKDGLTGTGSFSLAADGQSFTGGWSWAGQPNIKAGDWNGVRKAAEAPPPEPKPGDAPTGPILPASPAPADGGGGGAAFATGCENAGYVVGFIGYQGQRLNRLQPRCREWSAEKGAFGNVVLRRKSGGSQDGGYFALRCPDGYAVTGVRFDVDATEAGEAVGALTGLDCKDAASLTQFAPELGEHEPSPRVGPALREGASVCPEGQYVTGIHGRTTEVHLTALGAACGTVK